MYALSDPFFVIRTTRGSYVKVNTWIGDTVVTDSADATHFSTRETAKQFAEPSDDVIEDQTLFSY